MVETKANYLIGVPTHAVDLLAEVQSRDLKTLGDVTTFQMGGSPIPSESLRTLLRLGVAPQNAFGMTENCSFQYTRRGDSPETIIETCGRSCEGMEMKIWDQENADIEQKPNQVGELGCHGASLMLGYFDDQSNTERSFNGHGWFMTGDLGSLDEGGNLRIVGRNTRARMRCSPISSGQVRHNVPTIDMQVDYLRPASGKEIIAFASIVKLGRTISLVDIRLTDDEKKVVAVGRASYVTT